METLSHNDLFALNRAIGEVYTARDMDSFYRLAFSAIKSLIPVELCSFNEVIPHPTRFLKVIASSQEHRNVSSKLLPAFNAFIHEHPLSLDFFSGKVFKTKDRASRTHFKDTTIYNEYYKHLDVETQIGFSIPISQEKYSIVALSKKNPDFSERDRLLLSLLKPHLLNALRNATECSSLRLEKDLLQKGAEAESQGAIHAQPDGMILCLSPFAREMLNKYFDLSLVEGDKLSGSLLEWFKAETNSLSPLLTKMASMGSPKRVERKPLTIEKEGKCLKIKLLNDFTTGDYILVITEMDPSQIMQKLQGYGLSCREVEVLTWLSKGKTNEEIAIILDMSKRTAEKHLQNIFGKLGVETRMAAAAIMRN